MSAETSADLIRKMSDHETPPQKKRSFPSRFAILITWASLAVLVVFLIRMIPRLVAFVRFQILTTGQAISLLDPIDRLGLCILAAAALHALFHRRR